MDNISKDHVKKSRYMLAILRISMGWIFLWAFLDKLLGLGFATLPEKAWILGNSPTSGFLKFATIGPFAGFYQSIVGNPIIDLIFMLGLLFIGIALILGIGMRIAGYSGALMFLLMYTAGFLPPTNNPFLDEHIIYMIIMIYLAITKSGQTLGLGRWWANMKFIKKYPFLE